jgi:hypothetical protein
MTLPAGWTPDDPVTAFIAAAALILSIIQEIRNWRARRPEVIVEATIAPASSVADDIPRLLLTVLNRSDGTVYLSHIALASPQSILKRMWWKGPSFTWKSMVWPLQTALTYPYELDPQKDITDVLSLWQVADFLSRQGNRGTTRFQGCVRTRAGHWYRSKPAKFEMDPWLRPEAHVSVPLFQPVVNVPPQTVRTPVYEPPVDQDSNGR